VDILIPVAFVIGGLIGLLSGFFLAYFAKEAYLSRKIKRLEEENEDLDEENKSLKNTAAGENGRLARQEKKERLQAAVIEIMGKMKEGNVDMPTVLKEIGAKYPDVAMDLIKKGAVF
jgi:hypothetical protein